MKVLLIAALLLVAAAAPPAGHGAHRPGTSCRHHCPRLQPVRVLRTPQPPKSVRPVK